MRSIFVRVNAIKTLAEITQLATNNCIAKFALGLIGNVAPVFLSTARPTIQRIAEKEIIGLAINTVGLAVKFAALLRKHNYLAHKAFHADLTLSAPSRTVLAPMHNRFIKCRNN